MTDRTPLPQARIDEIVREYEEGQWAADEKMMAEKMEGLRCMSCDCSLAPPASGARRCKRCEGWI